jgi:hypothetical protein
MKNDDITTKYVVTTTYINRGLDYVSKYTTRTRSALSGMFTSSWYTHLYIYIYIKEEYYMYGKKFTCYDVRQGQ